MYPERHCTYMLASQNRTVGGEVGVQKENPPVTSLGGRPPKELGQEEATRYIPEKDTIMPETKHTVWHTESIQLSAPGTSDNLPSNPPRATFSPSRRGMLQQAALQNPYTRTDPKSQAAQIKTSRPPTLPCPPTPPPSPCRLPPGYPPWHPPSPSSTCPPSPRA